jgi:hypothetical protein
MDYAANTTVPHERMRNPYLGKNVMPSKAEELPYSAFRNKTNTTRTNMMGVK